MTSLPPVLNADTLNRYHLQIKGCDISLDVELFGAREALSDWCEVSVFGTAPGELLISTEKLELPTVRNDLLNKQE